MHSLVVQGNNGPIYGSINVSGSKNSVLPLMAAALLTDEQVVIENTPTITDVDNMTELLRHVGAEVLTSIESDRSQTLKITARQIANTEIVHDASYRLRASILLLGGMLSRNGQVKVNMPGGCFIGSRPIDFHIDALQKMGASINRSDKNLEATGRLQGAVVALPNVSVGTTENLLMAATLADGVTTLKNIAMEPEVMELVHVLRLMGSDITLCTDNTAIIVGKKKLRGYTHRVSGDRVEAGTYAMALAAVGGEIKLIGIDQHHCKSWLSTLLSMGVSIKNECNEIALSRQQPLKPVHITTRPHPYFPSDLQSPLMAALLCASGISVVCETLYENRFMHVAEFVNMGADIEIIGNKAIISGGRTLTGSRVRATDLRAGGALVIAAMMAHGETIIDDAYHLDRGYACIEDKLGKCGVRIKRVV